MTLMTLGLLLPELQAQVSAPTLKWQRGGCGGSSCQDAWYSSPAVADLDGDGMLEVIYGSRDVVVLNGATGAVRARGASGSRVWPGVAVADLRGDGTLEIVVGREGNQVHVYRFVPPSTLSVVWSTASAFPTNGEVRTLAVEDLDTNGRLEVVVGRASGGSFQQLNAFNFDTPDGIGTVRPGWPARRVGEPGSGWGMYNENVTIGDLNGDGLKEVIGPTDTHYITALDHNGNQLGTNAIYNTFNPPGPKVWSQVGVHVDQAADLRGFANCGTEHRPNFANSAPAIADVDGNGTPEIVVIGDVYNCGIGDPAGDLYHMPWILNLDRTRWSGSGFNWTVLPTPGPGSAPLPGAQDFGIIQSSVQNVVVADLDGDGRKEILFPSYDGKLHAYWLDKTEHGSWPYTVPAGGAGDEYRFASEPAVADLDNDGQAEVIFTSWPKNGGNRVGHLHILSSLGVELHRLSLPAPFGGTYNGGLAGPTLANLDGDPDLEVVVGTRYSGAVAYDLPGTASARILWGTGRGTNKRTGVVPVPVPIPSISISDVSRVEGNSGTTNAVFTLALSTATAQPVTVNFATADGTAVAPGDYTTTSGSGSFAPGTVTQTISVPVVGDTAIEGNETFSVSLAGAVGATIGDAQGQGTIVNDDLPSIAINDVSVVEGNSGTTNAVFTLTLSQAAPFAVSVNFATANGSAVAPGDYTAVSGSRSFAPGTVTQTISVPVVGDLAIEEDEVFFVSLGGPSGATISDALGVATIVNDDLPSIAINDVSVVEGNSGTTNAVFTLTLSQPAPFAVSVNFATANGSAVEPGDYTAAAAGRTFSPGAVTQTIAVPVVGDLSIEENEIFFVSLGGASGATISDALGVATITNDDLPTLSVNDVVITEGNTGSQNAVFTVSLSQAVSQAVTVNYGVAAGTATAGEDFGTAGGTLIFPGGTTTLPAEVPVFGDWIAESTETFTLNLSAPTGATLADGTGAGTITDDDLPGLTINDAVVRERPTPSSATATFTVTLAPANAGVVTVNYGTADGTATVGNDYVLATGPLVFAPGETTKNVTVSVNPDAVVEGMETFAVNLSGASGAAIAHGTGTGQILDPPLGGDFNTDNNNDLVWRHDISGENVVWYMSGATLLGGTLTTPPALADPGWKIVGTNDFNADARPDLLWRHTVSGQNVLWYMNGAVMQSGTFLTPAALADVNWRMAGTGDFNVDGKPDILWRHEVSGQIVVWYMGGADGSVLQSGEFLTPSAFTDVNWQTVGTGDFNLDGRTDILWRHAVAGQNVVWFMKGSKLMSGAFLNPPALVDVNWRMVATGDYNNDGKVDIVWRHSVSGQNVMWFMDGINMTGGGFTTTLADTNWKIVGPR